VDESFMGNNCLFEEGDKVDNYLVEKVLANKNNIDIYLVSDVDHQMYVLKLLNQQKLGTEKDFKKALKELKKEYEVLCNLNNVPSISHVFGFNEEHDTFCYFVMEYIDGRSISRHLEEHEELSIQAALQLIEGIIKAFSLLHTANLIHGDIHSANVLVLPDQSIKIIDVGLSRNVQPEKEQVLKFGGVHHYMPPERINITTSNKYSKEPDLYSDVYEIGLLAYLVLYNHLPFDGFIWEELAKNIKEQEAEFPEKSFSGYSIPNALIDVIKKCTSKNATDRYANAGEILKDFKLRL
jgi:serine/threonine-protein kinase